MISQESPKILAYNEQARVSVSRSAPRLGYGAALVVADVASTLVAFGLAFGLRFEWAETAEELARPLSTYLSLAAFTAATSSLFFSLGHLYDQPRHMGLARQLYGIVTGASAAFLLMMALMFLTKEYTLSRLFVVLAWAIAILTVSLTRMGLHLVFLHLQSKGIGAKRLLVVGGTELALSVARVVHREPQLGYRVVAMESALDAGWDDGGGHNIDERIDRLVRDRHVDEVIVALPAGSYDKLSRILRCCRRNKVPLKAVPEFFDMASNRVELEELGPIPLVSFRTAALSSWSEGLKRVVDLCLVVPALLLLAPLFGVVALAIKLESPGPILYRQTRVGRGGVLFEMYKFRSMVQDADRRLTGLLRFNECSGPLFKMRRDPRVTRVGRWIRRLSVDELPQLFNVLCGQMSLVGPRPPLPNEVERYEDWHVRRLEATPGLTGLWQVSGRSNLSFSDMVKLDLYYIDNWSLGLDLTILLRTIPSVLRAHGAY